MIEEFLVFEFVCSEGSSFGQWFHQLRIPCQPQTTLASAEHTIIIATVNMVVRKCTPNTLDDYMMDETEGRAHILLRISIDALSKHCM